MGSNLVPNLVQVRDRIRSSLDETMRDRIKSSAGEKRDQI